MRCMEQQATDYLIECGSPKAFDQTVNSMGAMLEQDAAGEYVLYESKYYRMRVLGSPGFLEFAIPAQGYGKIIRKIVD
jgi:hypothetical protein